MGSPPASPLVARGPARRVRARMRSATGSWRSSYRARHLTSGRDAAHSGGVTHLVLPDDVVFTCQQSGACCRNDWLIGVDEPARARLEAVDWTRLQPPLPPGPKFRPLPFALPGGERATFTRRADGACVFLEPNERCGIHTRLGAGAKPQVCREFPYSFVETPDGVAVGLSFACTAVRAHQGRALSEQQPEIREVLAGSTRVRRLPDPLVLYASVDITWAQYCAIEAALLALLAHEECTLPTALLAGSVLISLCVGLSQVEAMAEREGRAPTETLLGGLAQLATERYRKVIEVAARARAPHRPRLTALAPLYTWLEFSRRRPSRVGLILALYRNFFRFRRGRGRLPDWITGGPPLDHARALRVHEVGRQAHRAAPRSLAGDARRRQGRRASDRAALRAPRALRRRLHAEPRADPDGRPPVPRSGVRARSRSRTVTARKYGVAARCLGQNTLTPLAATP
ncbi:MAG: hypothetical protein DMD85_03125 [Candidatus Rokuibacteriota bacterium]|nr:MAG: hypothetical protein DMD85_03125 [Candidatus Rokubacteria bacterium]